jgi:inner membrane transporter RhtA
MRPRCLCDDTTSTHWASASLCSDGVPNLFGLTALRRVTASAMGIFMSLNPAVVTLAGAVFLAQIPVPVEVLAIALVVVASAGANRDARGRSALRPPGETRSAGPPCRGSQPTRKGITVRTVLVIFESASSWPM